MPHARLELKVLAICRTHCKSPAGLYLAMKPAGAMSFFFPAEDGIRDGTVTGVQTCALPISAALIGSAWEKQTTTPPACAVPSTSSAPTIRACISWKLSPSGKRKADGLCCTLCHSRSEERRVGREGSCRCGGGGAWKYVMGCA